ncbi:uncharacterized protein LOC126676556 isoform X2 [Mercurialis annua]|nr:uncharacterized protein LOC126676556 isoform X2 [Mercurialis annua]
MMSGAPTQSTKEQPPSQSDSLDADRRSQTVGTGATYFPEKTSGESQVAMVGGLSGHDSVADVVKMGQLHSKGSHMKVDASCRLQDIETPDSYFHISASYDSLLSSKGIHQDLEGQRHTNVSEIIQQSRDIISQQDYENKWPMIKQQTAVNRSSTLNIPTASDVGLLPHHTYSLSDDTKLHKNCQSKDVQVSQSSVDSYIVESNSPSSNMVDTYGSRSDSPCNDGSLKDMISYGSSRCINELLKGKGSDSAPLNLNDEISSSAVSLQQLSLGEDIKAAPLPEDRSNMQDIAAGCENSSFTELSCPLVSDPLKSNLEVTAMDDGSSILFGSLSGEELRFMSAAHPSTGNVWHQDLPEVLQPESSRQNINEFYSHGHDFNPLKSLSTFSSKNIQEPNFPPTLVIEPQDRDLTQDLQPIKLPSLEEILASITSDFDGLNSSFAEAPPSPSRHGDILCGVNSTTPMNEIANSGFFSGMSLPLGHAPPQNLSAHSLSSNLTAFPTGPQPYIHTRSAINQAYQDSSTYNDPSEGMTYNYQKIEGIPSFSSPLSNAKVFGYGHVGNPTNFAGSFVNNLPTTPNAAAAGYDDRLNVQHVQQNDGFSSRGHVAGLRALPLVPDNRYNLLSHGQLLSTPQEEGQSLVQYQHDQQRPTYYQHGQLYPTYPHQYGQPRSAYNQLYGQPRPAYHHQHGQLLPTYYQLYGQPYHPYHQHGQPRPTDHQQRPSHYPFQQQQQQQQSQGYGARGSTDIDNSQQSSNDPPNFNDDNFQG